MTLLQVSLLLGAIANLCLLTGFVWKGLSVLITMRDELRFLIKDVGSKDPPSGILGDIDELQRVARRHREWLIEINANLPEDNRIRMERS